MEVSILDRGAPASGRAAELRDALWDQLGLVLRYRAADAGEETATPWLRDGIAAPLREREDEQEELVSALRARADGLAPVSYGEREGAARMPSDDARSGARPTPVVVLGSR